MLLFETCLQHSVKILTANLGMLVDDKGFPKGFSHSNEGQIMKNII